MSLAFWITLAVSIVIGLFTVLAFLRTRSYKAMVLGIGLMLLTVGLHLMGVVQLTINGVRSLVSWVQSLEWGGQVAIGSYLAGGGLLLGLISTFLKAPTAEQVAQRSRQRNLAKQDKAAVTSTSTQASRKPATPRKDEVETDPADAEVEEILRRRGIM